MMTAQKILYISGWGAGAEIWAPIINTFGKDENFLHIPWWHCLEADKNQLLQIIEDNASPVKLIGWSLGALLALQAAIALPGKISAMLLISPTANMTEQDKYQGTERKAIRAMRNCLRSDRQGVLREFSKLCLAPQINNDFTIDFMRNAGEIDTSDLKAGLRYLEDTNLHEALPGIKTPTVILHGENDQIIPLDSGRYIAEQMPNASFEVLASERHALPYTAPQRVAEAIRSMIDAYSVK